MLNHTVFVYIDDILIVSKSLEVHRVHVRQVLQRLENRLYVKAEKCEFHVSSVSFLGYIISERDGPFQGLCGGRVALSANLQGVTWVRKLLSSFYTWLQPSRGTPYGPNLDNEHLRVDAGGGDRLSGAQEEVHIRAHPRTT